MGVTSASICWTAAAVFFQLELVLSRSVHTGCVSVLVLERRSGLERTGAQGGKVAYEGFHFPYPGAVILYEEIQRIGNLV